MSTFTKKHYNKIATELKLCWEICQLMSEKNQGAFYLIVNHMCARFAADNYMFSRSKFLEAIFGKDVPTLDN